MSPIDALLAAAIVIYFVVLLLRGLVKKFLQLFFLEKKNDYTAQLIFWAEAANHTRDREYEGYARGKAQYFRNKINRAESFIEKMS